MNLKKYPKALFITIDDFSSIVEVQKTRYYKKRYYDLNNESIEKIVDKYNIKNIEPIPICFITKENLTVNFPLLFTTRIITPLCKSWGVNTALELIQPSILTFYPPPNLKIDYFVKIISDYQLEKHYSIIIGLSKGSSLYSTNNRVISRQIKEKTKSVCKRLEAKQIKKETKKEIFGIINIPPSDLLITLSDIVINNPSHIENKRVFNKYKLNREIFSLTSNIK